MRRARWRLRMTAEMARDYVQMWWADVGSSWPTGGGGTGREQRGRRMDAINAEVVRANRKIDFLVKALKDVVKDEPSPGVKALAAVIKGGGCRTAPRRPGLHLVAEVDR